MKTIVLLSSLLFLSLSFFPSAFSDDHHHQPPVIDLHPPVIDRHGRPLEYGVPYYALSGYPLLPQGFCLVNIKNNESRNDQPPVLKNQHENCPNDVIRCTLKLCPIIGFPVVFTTLIRPVDNLIRENTPYYIRFYINRRNCSAETYLGLGNSNFHNFVTARPQILAAQFQIQRTFNGYRIVHCPLLQLCYPVGLQRANAYNRFGVGIGFDDTVFSFASGYDPAVENQSAAVKSQSAADEKQPVTLPA